MIFSTRAFEFDIRLRVCSVEWTVQTMEIHSKIYWIWLDLPSCMETTINGENKLPEFDLYLGVNFWLRVRCGNALDIVTKEIIGFTESNTMDVCLINKGLGAPFISASELRPLIAQFMVLTLGHLHHYYSLKDRTSVREWNRSIWRRCLWTYCIINFIQAPEISKTDLPTHNRSTIKTAQWDFTDSWPNGPDFWRLEI